MALYCAPRGVSALKKKKKRQNLFDLILFICEVQSARTGIHLRASNKLTGYSIKFWQSYSHGWQLAALPLNSFKMHLLAFPFPIFFLGAHAQMRLEYISTLDPLTSTWRNLHLFENLRKTPGASENYCHWDLHTGIKSVGRFALWDTKWAPSLWLQPLNIRSCFPSSFCLLLTLREHWN